MVKPNLLEVENAAFVPLCAMSRHVPVFGYHPTHCPFYSYSQTFWTVTPPLASADAGAVSQSCIAGVASRT